MVNYKQEYKHFLLIRACVYLVFVCRSINLQIFTEISRFFYISFQIFGVLRLRGLLSELTVYCFDLFFKASQLSNKPDVVIGLIFLYALYVHASNKMTKDRHKTSYSA